MKRREFFFNVDNLKVPYFEVGYGRPLISFVAGIHGDETNSQLVIDRLLEKVKKINSGTIRVIPFANLSAVEENIREFPDTILI